jgi:hypothetical protein
VNEFGLEVVTRSVVQHPCVLHYFLLIIISLSHTLLFVVFCRATCFGIYCHHQAHVHVFKLLHCSQCTNIHRYISMLSIPGCGGRFSVSHDIQMSSGNHTDFYAVDIRRHLPGMSRQECKLNSHLHLVVYKMRAAFLLRPLIAIMTPCLARGSFSSLLSNRRMGLILLT